MVLNLEDKLRYTLINFFALKCTYVARFPAEVRLCLANPGSMICVNHPEGSYNQYPVAISAA